MPQARMVSSTGMSSFPLRLKKGSYAKAGRAAISGDSFTARECESRMVEQIAPGLCLSFPTRRMMDRPSNHMCGKSVIRDWLELGRFGEVHEHDMVVERRKSAAEDFRKTVHIGCQKSFVV